MLQEMARITSFLKLIFTESNRSVNWTREMSDETEYKEEIDRRITCLR